MKPIMSATELPQQTDPLAIEQSLQQAIAYHQTGRLQDAESLYHAVLEVQPDHPDVKLNLEALAMQVKLIFLFTGKHFAEATALAQSMTERFPLNGFGWMMLGMLFRQEGRIEDALVYTQKGAELSLTYAAAHYNLGNIFIELERLEEAEACFRKALQIRPDYAEAHNNLGCILKDLRRLNEAEACCRRALQVKPDFSEAYNNLGVILKKLGQMDEAEACCRRALQIKPDYAEAHNNLGLSLHKLGQLAEAEASFRRSLQIKPDYAEVYGNLGLVIMDQGKLDESLACFQQQVRLAPKNSIARHFIALLAGNNTERAPIEYIESVFDGYANNFDTHLQKVLGYEAPRRLVELVMRHTLPPVEKWDVLDLGCGTGLVGLEIAPFAQQLVGVDLSTRMLEKADARNLYQRLECSDLLTMMCGESASSYDVVVAADVFVYLGKLDEIIGEIRRLLRPGGIFAFSVEDLVALRNGEGVQGNGEYQLEATGRYTHSMDYLDRLASANGLLVQEVAAVCLRTEKDKPVNGHLVVWKSGAPRCELM